MSVLADAVARVPVLLAGHVLLSEAALLLGLAISLPLGLLSARRPGVARVALGFASLVQTIPSLALLALFYPLLLALSSLLGGHVSTLGFLPSLMALTLYALLPILRNAVAGLRGIDPAVLEAADAVGMTAAQKLRLVEAPLALPILVAGVRTAAVWTIGAATLSTTIGYASLGDLIFAGLQTQAWALVLVGCVAAAALALSVDLLIGAIERGLSTRRGWMASLAAVALTIGAAIATLPLWTHTRDERRVVVGAKNFAEQYILSRLIGERLAHAGYHVTYRDGLGSSVVFEAVASGAVDVYVDYSGTLWTQQMRRTDVPGHAAMIAALRGWAWRERHVTLMGTLGFENAYAFAMRAPVAEARRIATLADLARASPAMRLGSDLEFLDRGEWTAVQRAYPMRFAAATRYSPTFMYRALESGRADVITAFSSDGRIAADGLRVLRDPAHAIPGYDAVLLVSPAHARDGRMQALLRPLLGHVPVEAMRAANYQVDRDDDKRSPEQAAEWLARTLNL